MIIAMPPMRSPSRNGIGVAADAGQQVVGEQLAGFGRGLGLATRLFFGDDDRRQRGGVARLGHRSCSPFTTVL